MFKKFANVALPVVVLSLFGAKAIAGDVPLDTLPPPPYTPELRGPQPEMALGDYGNIHGGIDATYNTKGTGGLVPMVNVGAKYAHDGGVHEIGYQVDYDMGYVNSAATSNLTGGSFSDISYFDAAAHLTTLLSQDTKIGVFAGTAGLGLSGITLPANYLNYAHTQNFNVGGPMFGGGVEALYAFSPTTSVQTRAALLAPNLIRVLGFQSIGGNAAYPTPLGLGIMAGVSHRLSQNISGRVDGTYINWPSLGQSQAQVAITGQYNLDEQPIALGATVGYDLVSGAPVDATGIFGKIRATYSFGGPSNGAAGKLFRSGILGVMN